MDHPKRDVDAVREMGPDRIKHPVSGSRRAAQTVMGGNKDDLEGSSVSGVGCWRHSVRMSLLTILGYPRLTILGYPMREGIGSEK